jgi:hypothetical protein
MRVLILLTLLAITFSNAKAYEVEDGKQQGFTVTADNFVYITTSNQERIQVTDVPFVGDGYSIPPR